MKKYLSFAVTAMAILSLGSLTSCHDEDFDVSTTVLQERSFEQGFIKEFGKPDANQSWDFYAQMMESLRGGAATRATMAEPVFDTSIGQTGVDEWLTEFSADIRDNILKDGRNNASAGQNNFSLVSTGEFKLYAVHYGGNIEHYSNHDFHFGIGYYDSEDHVTEKVLFDGYTEGTSTQVNPGYGAKIVLDPGTKFYFYITYKVDHNQYRWRRASGYSWHYVDAEEETYTRKYYTNANPSAQVHKSHSWNTGTNNPDFNDNIETNTYLDYPGAATLLYSTEHDGKQYMIIGFEDAWHFNGCFNNGPDYDYNDIIFVLEGQLPVPTSKRFFCEDRQKYDWDYNDVVFDVTTRGIVLRAVGGTLPVYLDVTDKNGKTWTYGELHELMWEMQADGKIVDGVYVPGEKEKHPVKTFVKNGKTYYKPIRVGANPGLPIEAVQLEPVWNYEDMNPDETFEGEGLALTDAELVRFANPRAENPVGAVRLRVGQIAGEDVVTENGQTVKEEGSFQVVESSQGVAPAIWSAPSSVAWTKEMVKITKAYPGFYNGNGTASEETGGLPTWWTIEPVNLGNTYQFSGDYDPDRVPNN